MFDNNGGGTTVDESNKYQLNKNTKWNKDMYLNNYWHFQDHRTEKISTFLHICKHFVEKFLCRKRRVETKFAATMTLILVGVIFHKLIYWLVTNVYTAL